MIDLTYISSTTASSGTNELVAAPGSGRQIVVTGFTIQNETSTATTMKLQSGASDVYRLLGQDQGDGITKEFHPKTFWQLGDNSALNLNLSGANTCGYSVAYYTDNT
jgi:hypothetical protein